jgi:hypothetical protein
MWGLNELKKKRQNPMKRARLALLHKEIKNNISIEKNWRLTNAILFQ